MSAKKKAPAKAPKNSKPKAKEDPRAGVTTVDSTAKSGNHDTTRPSSAVPKLPPEVKAPSSPVKVQYPARERRVAPEGRRGRFAEKAPPGTRTKMLKIIYDRKAEMARKRQNALVGKLILAVVVTASLYYGAQHAIDFTTRGFASAIEWLDLQGWWSNVASRSPQPRPQHLQQRHQPQPATQRPRARPASTYRQSAGQQTYRRPTLVSPQGYQRQTVRRKVPATKVTYGQTTAYRGRHARKTR